MDIISESLAGLCHLGEGMSLTDFTFPCCNLRTVSSESHITGSCGSWELSLGCRPESRYSGKARGPWQCADVTIG